MTGVVVERNGRPETYLGATSSSSSCGAINSAALLLRSANDKHPSGLANGSDVVGRHYMGHVNSVLMADLEVPQPDRVPEDAGRERLLLRLEGLRVSRWGTSRSSASSTPSRCRRARRRIAPGFTLDLMAKHSLDFWLTSEDLPDPNNRVTLDKDGNIVLTYTPNNVEGHERLTAKLKDLLQQP